MAPWQFLNLLKFVRTAEGPVKTFGAAVILATVATPCFRHCQRTGPPRFEPSSLSSRVSFGKRRQFGIRPGFEWAVPRGLAAELCIFDELESFYQSVQRACQPGT